MRPAGSIPELLPHVAQADLDNGFIHRGCRGAVEVDGHPNSYNARARVKDVIRVLDLSFGSIQENLAFDAESLNSPGETLRFWERPHHTVVMGRSGQAEHNVRMPPELAGDPPLRYPWSVPSLLMEREFAFEMAASNIRYGPGVTAEIGHDVAGMGLRRVAVFTDPHIAHLSPFAITCEALQKQGVEFETFTHVRIEPSDRSFRQAIEFATNGHFDGFVAVGGGSTIDTAKAANLYSTYPPEDFLDYVNPPIGKGKPIPGRLKPLFAIPTTAGTGSETTGVSIFDYSPLHAKTGIASRLLKPTLGLLDPENTRTMPPEVAASTGLDVLCHAIESYTAISYRERPRPDQPALRPAYQGRNPFSDVWALQSLRMVSSYIRRAFADPADNEARAAMILASAYAGVGFGNAGVHLPHGMSYPVSGMVRDYKAPGYRANHPLVPHGVSVILNAPAVFRFTAGAHPQRHLAAAEVLGADISHAKPDDAGKILADTITEYLQDLRCPNGLKALGYTSTDIPKLVQGTLPQHRVTKLSPRPAGEEELAKLFEDAMTAW